ncbi:MAG: ATP-binding cassette domain-containing protein, partial [Oscillospiraceae bacterium]|nr:ATP-binding cassette domain-containing protein [Oscillospiraceae bacterium]
MRYCLQTQGLSAGYDGKPILKEITLSVGAGEILTLVGPNGAGKSTLIRAILGERDYTGSITFSTCGERQRLRI